MDLRISRSQDGAKPVTTVVVTGFVDISNSRELVDAGTQVLSSGEHLALDLTAVDFMDSTGIGALVQLAATAQTLEQVFEVTACSAPVRRVLEITGLADRWSPASTPSD